MVSGQSIQQLFETFGKSGGVHEDSVNRGARERLREQLMAGAGRCVLLKAPRAGYGKTHLLTRLQHDLGGTHEFVPLHAVGGSRIDAVTVLDDVMRRLVRPLPAAAGLTVFDLVARRILASALQPLVRAGEVPCQDREGALNALSLRPIETFDFHHPSAVTAHWARENFELLGPRLVLELSNRNGIALREVAFWVEAMFRFAATPLGNPGRIRVLFASVLDGTVGDMGFHERLVALLGILCSLMRVVLVADELEGFSTDESAALRFASFVISLRQEVESLEVVISLNEDVWKNAFVPRLSGGLVDRLSELVIELEPLDREGAVAVLNSRMPGYGEILFREMEVVSLPSYARGLLAEVSKFLKTREEVAVKEVVGEFAAGEEIGESSIFEKAEAGVFEMAPDAYDFAQVAEPLEVVQPVASDGVTAGMGSVQEWPQPDMGEFIEMSVKEAAYLEAREFVGVPEQVAGVVQAEQVAVFESVPQEFGGFSTVAEDPNRERVDELLRQFRERYGKG
jgi:hypothetical protein